MAVRMRTQTPLGARLSGAYNELVRENAMLDEATRFVRQFLRTGGDSGKGVNYVIIGLMAMFYLWFMATMIRWNVNLTIPLEYAELVLVTLFAPISIYAAISGEREKATWDALVLTRLTPAQIIVGKLLWRLAIVAAIMAIMMFAIVVSQFLGNEDPGNPKPTFLAVVLAQAMIFTWGVLLSGFSLWVSSRTNRSVNTVALVVGTLLFSLAMLPALFNMFNVQTGSARSHNVPDAVASFVMAMNPYAVLDDLTGHTSDGSRVYNVLGQVVQDRMYPPLALWLPLIYALGATLFLYLAFDGIRRLEEPVRKG